MTPTTKATIVMATTTKKIRISVETTEKINKQINKRKTKK